MFYLPHLYKDVFVYVLSTSVCLSSLSCNLTIRYHHGLINHINQSINISRSAHHRYVFFGTMYVENLHV